MSNKLVMIIGFDALNLTEFWQIFGLIVREIVTKYTKIIIREK